MTLQELLVNLKLNASQFTAGVQSALGQWQNMSGAMIMGGAALSAGVTAPLVGLASSAMAMAQKLQSAEIGFTTMLGSAEEAGAYLQELKDFAAQTPFEFSDLVTSAQRMKALGFEAKDVIPTLTALGNAAAGLGRGSEWIDRVTLALGQMQAKGKVTGEEMRQLTEAGVKGWQILADYMGTSVKEVMALATKGMLDSTKAVPVLIAGINKDFDGLMKNFSETVMGRWSNLKDSIGYVMGDIGKALMPIANQILQDVLIPLGEKVKELAQWFSELSPPVRNTVVVVAALAAAVGPLLLLLGGMAMSLNAITTAAGVLGPLLGGVLGGGLKVLAAAVSPLLGEAGFSGFGAAIAGLGPIITTLMPLLAGLGVVIGAAFGIDKALTYLDRLDQQLADSEAAMAAAKASGGTLADKLTFLEDRWQKAGGSAAQFARDVTASQTATELYGREVQRLIDKLDPTLVNALSKGTGQMSDALANLGTYGREIGQSAAQAEKAAEVQQQLNNVFAVSKYVVKDAAGVAVDLSNAHKLMSERGADATRVNYQNLEALRQGKAITVDFSAALGDRKRTTDAASASTAKDSLLMEDEKAALKEAKEEQKKVTEALKKYHEAATENFLLRTRNQEELQKELKTMGEMAAAVASVELALIATEGPLMRAVKGSADLTEALSALIKLPVDEFAAAFATLGITSRTELNRSRDAAEAAYRIIAESGIATPREIAEAWVRYLEVVVEAEKGVTTAVTEQHRKQLDVAKAALGAIEGETKKSAEHQMSAWQRLGSYMADLFRSLPQQLTRGIWNVFGDDTNEQLDEQAAELTASLAARTEEWEEYHSDVLAQMAQLTADSAAELAEETAELESELNTRRVDHEQYVADVEAQMAQLTADSAAKLSEETAEIQDALAERQEEHANYVADIQQQMDAAREEYADKLADELEDLRDNLADKTEAYEEFVSDTQTALGRLTEDTADNIEDETRQTKEGIQDKQLEFDRYQRDILAKIAAEQAKGAQADKAQIQSWRNALADKQQDLDIYIQRANADLADYIEEQRLREARQTADYQTELTRRTEDYQEFQAANLSAQAAAQTESAAALESELSDLQAHLETESVEWEQYQADAATQLASITEANLAELTTQLSDLQTQLDAENAEWSQYQADAAASLANITAASASELVTQLSDLQTALDDQYAEYCTYRDSIIGPDGELAKIEKAHIGVWDRIGGGFKTLFSQMGQVLTTWVLEELEGKLFKKLGTLLTDIFPAIGKWMKDLFGTAIDVGSTAADTASGAAGAVGSGASGAVGAASGLVGVVGAVGAIGSMISGIVGNFQMAGMNKTLDLIEESTRYLKVSVTQGSTSIGYLVEHVIAPHMAYFWSGLLRISENTFKLWDINDGVFEIRDDLRTWLYPQIASIAAYTDAMTALGATKAATSITVNIYPAAGQSEAAVGAAVVQQLQLQMGA